MANEMTQIKFTIETGIVPAFKARCADEGVSMTSAVREFMKNCRPAKAVKMSALTRRHRRKTLSEIIVLLNGILDMESEYRDNIPEQFTQRYEAADHASELLAETISNLDEMF